VPSRRRFVVAAAAAVTGCTGGGPATDDATTTPPDSTTTATTTTSRQDTTTTCTTPEHETTAYDPNGPCPTDRMADVVVFASDQRESTVSVTATREATGQVLLDETIETPVADPVKYADPIRETGVHRFAVEVTGGPSGTHEWDVASGEAETDSWQLQVSVGREEIGFAEVVH
jgi:hypothetical protein